MNDTEIIVINSKQYRITRTRGDEPSVYHANSFTSIGPPLSLSSENSSRITFVQNGDFILAVLEEIVEQ